MPAPGQEVSIPDDFTRATSAASFVLSQTPLRPSIGVILGSGLGGFADELAGTVHVPYARVPTFPQSMAVGHAGGMLIGRIGALEVVVMQGRIHLYEGYSAHEVAFPIRVLGRMGVSAIVLTNAAAGINPEYTPGTIAIIRDHINLQAQNPLVGSNDDRLGLRYPDMTEAYSGVYRETALQEGAKLGIALRQGIYAGVLGPSFETPAEINFLRTIGADLVGMSTVFEVIAARHMGIQILALSCVSNMAAGTVKKIITHEEVLDAGKRVLPQLTRLLHAVLPRIAAAAGHGPAPIA
jgi:purine-nucleoside phosphorylase